MYQTSKSLLASWTFWFGVCQIALAGVGYLSGLMEPMESFTLFTTGAGSIGLRLKTTAQIGSIT
jgi:hypothetical protein